MDQANTLVLRSKGSYKLLKISTGEIYYVIDTSGKKSTQHFNDYEDATDAFNQCVMEKSSEKIKDVWRMVQTISYSI